MISAKIVFVRFLWGKGQNPLHQFPRNFPVVGEVANLLPTCKVVVMEFGKRHDTTDTTEFCPRQLVADLSFMLQTCCGLATGNLVY